MLGQSQGRGYASSESSVPALKFHSSVLTCANAASGGSGSGRLDHLGLGSWVASIFDDCPMCGKPPLEAVRVEGQLACRACTGTCAICGAVCVPGDDACSECVRHLSRTRQAVLT